MSRKLPTRGSAAMPVRAKEPASDPEAGGHASAQGAGSASRLEMLADGAPVPIWMSDTQRLVFVNRAYEEFVGASEAEIRAAGPAEAIHPHDRPSYLLAFDEAVRARQPFSAQSRMRRADGEYRWMKSIATPRYGASGELEGYVGCSFELSGVEASEAALAQRERRELEPFAALAHELRNPLSAVRSASLLLRRTKPDPVVDEAREIIERQAEHMARIVDDLVRASALAHGVARTEPATAPPTSRRLLIVDDNEDSSRALRLMLGLDGHVVELVHEGRGAVEAASAMRADAVLLDIGLPDMDGHAVARALRDDPRTRDVLIIATTGYGREQDRAKSLRAGIDHHLTKPIDLDELSRLLAVAPAAR